MGNNDDWEEESPRGGQNQDNGNSSYGSRNRRDNGSQSYGRESQFKEEFLIDSLHCSAIIGRGGENIRALQQKFKVRIGLDRNTSEALKAMAQISGDRMEDITAASEEIRNICASEDDKYKSRQKPTTKYEVPLAEDGTIDYDELNRRCDEARRERWAKCPEMKKNFYTEHPEITAMTEEQAQAFRDENMRITVSRTFPDKEGGDAPIPNPVISFEHAFSAYPDMMEEIRKAGFTKPSPIQAQGWPVLLKGEDLIGIAQTGTGKTLAFLLPAMIHIDGQPVPRDQRGGPNVLIMAPTRELALQIEKEVEKYHFRDIKAVCLYGGGERNAQIKLVKEGAQIIIATPGRLNDLVAAEFLKIESITYLVLDEADRMLDMGFEPQIRKLLLDIRPDRQTVMTSATWPEGVRRLAASYMANPVQVCVGSLDLAATHTVTQHIQMIDEDAKFQEIIKFIESMKPTDKVIIFCGKKARADDLASDLALREIPNQSIHGNREQSDREQALADIKDGTVRILVATDVASRGLDIEDISHVVNMDFPRNIEEYVHRVGRTGRAGRTGVSLSFFTRSDWAVAQELIDILNEANQEVPPELVDMAERFKAKKERDEAEKRAFGIGGSRGGGGGRGGGFGGRGGGGGGEGFGDAMATIFVDKSKIGAVIGRGGSKIREIQDNFSVRVDIDKNFGDRAKVTVKARSQADVDAAIQHIEEFMTKFN